MLDTDSALYDLFAAPVLAAAAAALHSRPMLDTDSALLDIPAAPVLAAEFLSHPMLETDSALSACLLHLSWLQNLRLRFLTPLSLPCLTPRTHIA